MRISVHLKDDEGNEVGHALSFSAPLVLESTKEELETRILRDLKWAVETLFYRYLNKPKSKLACFEPEEPFSNDLARL